MNKFRVVSGIILLALLLLLVPASMAQDTFGLSAEDFALFTTANAASGSASSMAYDFTLDVNVSGGMGASGPVMVSLTGNGLIGGTSDSPLFQLAVNGTITAEGQTIPAQIEIRLTGNTLYFSNPSGSEPAWFSLTMDEFQTLATEMGGQLGVPVNPADFQNMDPETMAGLNNAITALSTLNPAEYVSMTRQADDAGMAHFTTTTDLSALVASQGFLDFLAAAAAMSGEAEMQNFSEAEMAAAGAMLGTILKNSSFTFDQYIDPATSLVNRAVIDLSLSVNPADLGQEGETATVDFTFDINLSGYNETYSVEAPAGAMSLMQMMGGMSQ